MASLSAGHRSKGVSERACRVVAAMLACGCVVGWRMDRAVAREAMIAVAPAVGVCESPLRAAAVERAARSGGLRAVSNRFVERWLDRLSETPPRLLDAYLARPEPWRGRLGPLLEAHDVPQDFLYLALIESGMDPEARSPAEAVGLWQFTGATARQYGLVVDDEVDQRHDERLATAAAGRYLRDLYEQFGTWELAAAAYNAGPGRVSRALAATDAETYWELVAGGHLPPETRAYVPRFIAVVQLAAERTGETADPAGAPATGF